MSKYNIEITEHSPSGIAEHSLLEEVIRRVLEEEQIDSATISLALVDDPEIHQLNRQFLGHDYPTDVISFLLNDPSTGMGATDRFSGSSTTMNSYADVLVDGELVVSVETAVREANLHGWSAKAELVLYVVHGLLHLCGYDDLSDEARPAMRSRERELLAHWGLCPTGLES